MVTLQGDVYQGDEERAGPGRQDISGANLLARWQRQSERGEFQLQGYYDHSRRDAPVDGVPLTLDTWDLEAQQSLSLGASNRLVWGMGVRVHHYDIVNSASLIFNPPSRTLEQWNLFVQDTLSLGSRLKATVGIKVERNDYTGWEPQPELRLSWQVNDRTLLWGAISRAVRSPTPLDADVEERVGSLVFLTGDPDFQSENVLAYELGYRGEPAAALSLSVSAFYNVYNDLRTVETASATAFLPLRWGNMMKGHTYGVTAWAKWQVTDWWRLAPGFALLRKDLQFKPGASTLLGTGQAGNDPRGHGLLSSSMRLGTRGSLDLTLRHVGALPDPALPAYTELGARLAWTLADNWEVALTGTNLLHARHREYPAPAGTHIRRSVLAEARWSR
jgi:iron complex outermembrane receptor protein